MSLAGYFEFEIVTDPDIVAKFNGRPPEDWFYGSSSLGIGENKARPEWPFFIWNELPDFVHREVRETSDARTRNFQWFLYDEPADFTRIDDIFHLMRKRVKAMAPFTTADGVRCSAAEWDGVSGNIPNDGYGSCTKFASVSFTVSR